MNVTTKQLEKSRIEISGELAASEFDAYIRQATDAFVAQAELDGFRKGKAPEKLVVQKIGEDKILGEAAERALQKEWPRVLAEQKIEALGHAEFHIIKLARGNNLVWKAIVATLPPVTLPDYKKIAHEINSKKETPTIEITDKEIDDTIAYIQKVRTQKDQPAPEINDDFAKSLGDFATLQALKDSIKNNLKLEKEQKATQEHQGKIIDTIATASTVDFPDVMIETEKNKMLRELQTNISDMGLSWSDYLAHIKKGEDEIKSGWQEDAQKRIKIGLSFTEIAKQEKIEPADEDIKKRLEKLLAPYSEEERKNIDMEEARRYAYNMLRNEKVIAFLEAIH